MRWDDISELPCPVAKTLSVVGDRWTFLILRDAFLGARRFDQFQRSLDCSPHTLSTRLLKLVEHGLFERRAYQGQRAEYRLTAKGRDLYPVMAGLLKWGNTWMADDDTTSVRLIHHEHGHDADPTLACSECGETLGANDVRLRLTERSTS